MIDELRARELQGAGLCFLCSMCEKMHIALEFGGDIKEISCMNECVGPLFGGCFELYKGPLERVKEKYCYLCGKASSHVIWPASAKPMCKIGVCADHVKSLRKMTHGNNDIAVD